MPTSRRDKLPLIFGASIIAATAILVYWGSLSAGFFPWDDPDLVVNNGQVHTLSAANVLHYFQASQLGIYQPMTMVAYAVQWAIGHGNPRVFHLFSILIHILSAVIVYRILHILTGSPWTALLTALLFVASPVQVESVAWVAEQKTVLSGLFYLLAMLQYLKWLDRRSAWGYALLIIFFLLALLSKATAVTLPLSLMSLLLFHVGFNGLAHHWRSLLPLALMALLFGSLAVWTQFHDGYLRPERFDVPLPERVVLASYALAKYAMQMAVPYGLSAFYPIPAGVAWHHVALGLTGLGGLLAFLWKPRAARAKRAGLVLMYAGPLLPVLQLLPFGEAFMADRYGYIACMPVYFLIARLLVEAARRSRARTVAARCAGIIILLLYAGVAQGRMALWGDEVALFQDIVGQYPDSDIAQFNLAVTYQKSGQPAEARTHFIRATTINPGYPQAWIGLGAVNAAMHRYGEAIANFSEAIRSAPGHANIFTAYYQRARCYAEEGKRDLAIGDLRAAIQRQRDYAPAHYLLAQELARSGNHAEAVEEYSAALLLGHDRTACLLNRAISLGWLGNDTAAIADLNSVVEANPKDATAWFLMGIAKNRHGANGCADLQRAAQLGHAQAPKALAEMCAGVP